MEQKEIIFYVEREYLKPFKNNPFKKDDQRELRLLKESVEQIGILCPLIVRPLKDTNYEIISGHRRFCVATQIGIEKLPIYIKDLNDDEATIFMIDSNLYRENISYSEKAYAYKMKYDAIKRIRGRRKSSQLDDNLKGIRTIEIVAQESGESYKQIQRYIKLTFLHPTLLKMLDDGEISFNPAVEIASLRPEEQMDFIQAMDYAQSIPSLSQAQRKKELSKNGTLTLEKMQDIMSEIKKGEISRVSFKNEQLYKFFPMGYTPAMMKREIINILKSRMESQNK